MGRPEVNSNVTTSFRNGINRIFWVREGLHHDRYGQNIGWIIKDWLNQFFIAKLITNGSLLFNSFNFCDRPRGFNFNGYKLKGYGE